MLTEALKKQVDAPLAAIPSGVAIMTATHRGDSTGMLASWVQQACFDPPMVTVAVKQGRPIVPLVEGSKKFVLCPVGENTSAMFKHFGKGFAPGEDAFAGIDTKEVDGGVVPADCIGHLVCALRGELVAGDHTIYLGEVVGGEGQAGGKPHVHLRKSGFSY